MMARDPEVQRRIFSQWYAENRAAALATQKAWRDSERGRAYRWRRTLSKHGLVHAEFDKLWNVQNGQCAGCNVKLVIGPNTHIDHCHATGVVRGLLCAACNLAIGKVKDKAETLRRLAAYLERAMV